VIQAVRPLLLWCTVCWGVAGQPAGAAQNSEIVGFWLVEDRTAVVEVELCGEARSELCGTLFPLARRDADPEHCGFPLFSGVRPAGPKEWRGGTIVDPRSGREYGVRARLEEEDRLVMRGYLLAPLLGRSQLWERWDGDDELCESR
jgi:uncharacterized protein (DUF2147 family)